MTSKTPKFTAKINEILVALVPHAETCTTCGQNYEITQEDIEIYKKFEVVPSGECFPCRRRRRFAFTNYSTLFQTTCDVPGHSERLIGSVPKPARFPIYDFDEYWKCDFIDWGVSYDLNDSFFNQFDKFYRTVPHPVTTRDPASVGSEYSLYGAALKNCYYTFGGQASENVMYSLWAFGSRDCIDMSLPQKCEGCYQGVFAESCFNCHYFYFSRNCLDSWFTYDCRNCSNCFGCVNLRNQKYCFFNEQLSKEDYEARVRPIIESGSYKMISEYLGKFFAFVKSQPVLAIRNEHVVNSTGNFIGHVNNCRDCFWIIGGENLTKVDMVMDCRDSAEILIGGPRADRCYYSTITGLDAYNSKFTVDSRAAIDSEYLIDCKYCTNCFACIGLNKKKFCIFNKQYTEEEYWPLLDEIKLKMVESGEYGRFFEYKQSPFPYNVSWAQTIFPTDKEGAEKLGAWWHDEPASESANIKLVHADEMPDNIHDVPDEILNTGFIDKFGKKFRIIKAELDFYRRKHLPLPRLAPISRFTERLTHLNNFQTGMETCAKCGAVTESSYFARDGYIVYCDKCFRDVIT